MKNQSIALALGQQKPL